MVTPNHNMSRLNISLGIMVILMFFNCVSCKWCTRLKAETTIHTIIEYGECKKSYHAACGWFTRAQCKYYEMVPCPKESNHTLVQYKIVSECCPGYKLDPINNITCITARRNEDAVNYYVSDDGLIFGLSPGAYAGIICSFLFVSCIIVLIILHVLKKRRSNSKIKDSKDMELEVKEKMIFTAKA